MKTQQEIESMIVDVLNGMQPNEDTYEVGYDIGYHNALMWVLEKVEL